MRFYIEPTTTLGKNADAEFKKFRNDMFLKTRADIFDSSFKISAYIEIRDYLVELAHNELSPQYIEAMEKHGETVISTLYDEYLKSDDISLTEYDDIKHLIIEAFSSEEEI